MFRRVFTDWGFDLVKLDFLYAAAPVNLPTESRAKRMRRAMGFLREMCGEHLIIGCGATAHACVRARGLLPYRVRCRARLGRLVHYENGAPRSASPQSIRLKIRSSAAV